MKTVIAAGGRARSGKSTFAQHLIKEAAMKGWMIEEVSFAQPIKNMLQEVFRYEVPYSTFTDDSRKQDKVEIVPGVYMTVREILQKVGTDCFRDVIHTDFWVARGIGKIKGSSADIVVVPDVRFANELEALNKLGTTVYVVKMTDEILPADTHPSEMGLEDIKNQFDHWLVSQEGEFDESKKLAKALIAEL